jgi:hypothetical protein
MVTIDAGLELRPRPGARPFRLGQDIVKRLLDEGVVSAFGAIPVLR